MLIIGEKINGMFKSVARAINERDGKAIKDLALAQVESGAEVLDVNVGPASSSPSEDMIWLIKTIMESDVSDAVRISIDTSGYEVMEKAVLFLKENYDRGNLPRPILNSTTADTSKVEKMARLAVKTGSELIILAMDSKGIPTDKDKKLELAAAAIDIASSSCGMSVSDIYIDPLVMPVAFKQEDPRQALEFISDVKILSDPPPKVVVGLSNVSQGAAARGILNRAFVAMALSRGLDAAILDPLDKELISEVAAAEILLNKTIYCESFVESFKISRRKKR